MEHKMIPTSVILAVVIAAATIIKETLEAQSD